jgi:hypothetical protein
MFTHNPLHIGRFMAHIDGDFVVFLIGAQLNRPQGIVEFVRMARVFYGMVNMLKRHPEKGYLHGIQYFSPWPPGNIMVQYWRDFESLERFAQRSNEPHVKAWRDYYRRVGLSGTIGIWHETYSVSAGAYEGIYGNMPRFGLARAGDLREIDGGDGQTARLRTGRGEQ